MFSFTSLLLLFCLLSLPLSAQDTFSIVAVDTITGEIGSAGASCVGGGVGAFILSDVIEGVGAIHTQASYLSQNQQTARNRMLLGDSPQQVLDWVTTHDAQNNPTVRQYGVVDLRRRGESAAYTGINCLDYKNHATAPGYSVQGNILLGHVIIDTMRNTFLRSPGPLADRLMATLEGAKIIGADTRCASRNTSSQSSFIKVVRIGDGSVPYLQKVVGNTASGVDPISVLHTQFNQWKDSLRTRVDPFLSQLTASPETLRADGTSRSTITIVPKNNSDTLLANGRTVVLRTTGNGTLSTVIDNGNGTYTASIIAPLIVGVDTISARVGSGSDTVRLAVRRVVRYVNATSVLAAAYPIPSELVLMQNYPNPFNPTTIIRYVLPHDSHVKLTLVDMLGRNVRMLINEQRAAGFHQFHLDIRGMSSGVYLVRLESGSATRIQKLTVLR